MARHAVRRARRAAARDTIAGPAVIRERNTTIVIEPGWRAEVTDTESPDPAARRAVAACQRHRHARRSRAARGVQQPVHVHRRADGRDAREHGDVGQYQGAPGFLLRAVRRAGQPDRERAAHAGAPRIDGRVGAGNHAPSRRHDAAGRCVRAECALRRRHAFAGCHGGDAGVPRRQAQPSSTSPRAAITPTSAASRPARCLPTRRTSTRRACCSTTSSSWRRAFSSKPSCARCSRAADIRRATSSRISRICARKWLHARRARPSWRRWSSISACRSCKPTCSTCRTTPKKQCAA